MVSLLQIVDLILDILVFFVFIHVIMSWLISFGVLNSRQQLVITIWRSLESILEPLYSRIRKIIPPINGGLDLAPLILLVAVYALRVIIRNNFTF
ncbi:MAG: YggT family protein [Paracoccaceae bacterium]